MMNDLRNVAAQRHGVVEKHLCLSLAIDSQLIVVADGVVGASANLIH